MAALTACQSMGLILESCLQLARKKFQVNSAPQSVQQ